MKLPWKKKIEEKEEEIRKLEERISEIREEKKRSEERFEAEQERRKKLSRQKQEAEEELNRLKDRLEQLESEEGDEEASEEEEIELQGLDFQEAYRLLNKLDSLDSDEKDMVTVYVPEGIDDVNDISGLKNSVTKNQYSKLGKLEGFVGFLDPDLGSWVLKIVPFFGPRFELSYGFDTDELLGFIESEKYWVMVSAGETEVYREENGDFEEVERVKNRVDREHSKGGFSQGRFERKREEQIETHLENVKGVLEEYEEEKIFLLGDERFCKELPGEYLGGFDPNRRKPGQFYSFQLGMF